MEKNKKFIPEKGTPLTIVSATGSERPYTVIGYERGKLLVQECSLEFQGTRYYDSLPEHIFENPWGKVVELNWAPKFGLWQKNKYEIAIFGKWAYHPHCD